MAGDAEVGGNGSIHWRVSHGGNQSTGKDTPGQGIIEVELIYDTPAQAAAAKQNLTVSGKSVKLTIEAHNVANKPSYTFGGQDAQVKITWS